MKRAILSGLAALSLLLPVAACGARLNEEQVAASRGAGPADGGAETGAPPGPGAARPGDGPATATTTGPGSAGVGPGGNAGIGADPARVTGGDGGAARPDGGSGPAVPCTPVPGSTEPGVTDTEVHLGNVSTISGPIAGFGQTGVNAVRAYFNYINALGGVCGRTLVLETGDDRLDTGVNRSETARLAERVLGFVGGTSVVDAGGASVLDGTDIPAVQLAVGDGAIRSPNNFSPSPIDPSGATQGTPTIWEYFARTRDLHKVAIVYPAQADARTRALAYGVDIRSAGLEVSGTYEVAITETNYVGVAQQIENSGADGFITALEITGMARLARALDQVGYHPKVAFYGAQAYGPTFLEMAGSAAEGTTLGLAYSIFEDAPQVPAVATFLDWYRRTAPGSKPDFFAVMGWTSADMLVQALAAAGGSPTRSALMQYLRNLHEFDAHGFIATNDPGGKVGAPGFMVATVRNGEWVREYPAAGGFGTGT